MGLFDRTSRDSPPGTDAQDRLPPGQIVTEKWPVLTYGETPQIDRSAWRLTFSGLVDPAGRGLQLDWDGLLALPRAQVTCDMHCVTRWTKFDNRFEGVRMRDLLDTVKVRPEARYVMAHCYGGYTTNVPLQDLRGDDVLLAHTFEGQPLEPEHGGPCRLLVPKLYLWKSAKWINGFEFLAKDQPGFWERGGYHMYGDPWKEERHGWTW